MRDMLSMPKGVAVRAQNNKVGYIIVRPIKVRMVDTKNFNVGIITTVCALFNPSPGFEGLSCKRKRTFPMFKPPFGLAFLITVFSFFRRGCFKRFFTLKASPSDRTASNLSLMIARTRTIFGYFNSKVRDQENRFTYLAFKFVAGVHSFVFPQTFSRTILGSFFSIFTYKIIFPTTNTGDF